MLCFIACICLFNQTYEIFISFYTLVARKLGNLGLNYRNHICALVYYFCFYLFFIALIFYCNDHVIYMWFKRIHSQRVTEDLPDLFHSHLVSLISSSSIFPLTDITPCCSLNAVTSRLFTCCALPVGFFYPYSYWLALSCSLNPLSSQPIRGVIFDIP